jgi:long-chain acyl-CoA synthetase
VNVASAPWLRGSSQPDAPALAGDGSAWTYGELRRRIDGARAALEARGVGRGDPVGLLAPTSPGFAAAAYGAYAAGAILVPANPRSTADELRHVFADAGCRLLVAGEESAALAAGAGAGEVVPLAPLIDGDAAPPSRPPAELGDGDVAQIVYTSGTTGRPKGAELSHGNLGAAAAAFAGISELAPADVVVTALPLFHVYGGAFVMGGVLQAGAKLALASTYAAETIVALLAEEPGTVFVGVPTMLNGLLALAPEELPPTPALRLCVSGGAPLPERVFAEIAERFGARILEGYGMTETSGAGTFTRLDREVKPGSVGRAVPGCRFRVVGEDGADAAAGEVGEVLLGGATLMRGYRGNPAATTTAIRDGWMHTGDLGVRDEDGDLRIVDRLKRLILHGGFNVYPREVEEVLFSHPDVREAAVLGIPDDHYGEEVAAAVVLRPGATTTPEALRAFVRERLSGYKSPSLVALVEELEKGPTGKILPPTLDRDAFARVR